MRTENSVDLCVLSDGGQLQVVVLHKIQEHAFMKDKEGRMIKAGGVDRIDLEFLVSRNHLLSD